MKKIEDCLNDESFEQFVTDSDLNDVLYSFCRREMTTGKFLITPDELRDRLVFLREQAINRAEKIVFGSEPPDDPEAREGTWDEEHA